MFEKTNSFLIEIIFVYTTMNEEDIKSVFFQQAIMINNVLQLTPGAFAWLFKQILRHMQTEEHSTFHFKSVLKCSSLHKFIKGDLQKN